MLRGGALGRMRHIGVRDLWLKEKVRKGMVAEKAKGDDPPADLMTKFLGKAEVEERLRRMRVEVKWRSAAGKK